MLDLDRLTKRERELYDAGLAANVSAEPAQKSSASSARWASGGVAGGSVSVASIANILGHFWPSLADVATDIAAIIVVVGAAIVGWFNRPSTEPGKPG